MTKVSAFFHWLGTPFRSIANAFRLLVNLSSRQIKALFSLAMLGGMVTLSFQNVALTYAAKRAVEEGDTFRIYFDLIQEQMRFNSGLIAWFAVIMGLIVFGADYFRAKVGDKEVAFGSGEDIPNHPLPTEPPTPRQDQTRQRRRRRETDATDLEDAG